MSAATTTMELTMNAEWRAFCKRTLNQEDEWRAKRIEEHASATEIDPFDFSLEANPDISHDHCYVKRIIATNHKHIVNNLTEKHIRGFYTVAREYTQNQSYDDCILCHRFLEWFHNITSKEDGSFYHSAPRSKVTKKEVILYFLQRYL